MATMIPPEFPLKRFPGLSAALLVAAAFAPAAALFVAVPADAQETSETRAIDQVSGNLYRWTAGAYHSYFLVHADGIVVGDPLSAKAARWLKGQLARRFPDKPITHVIYSHNHPDHEYGGRELDGPGVTFIAQKLAKEDLVRTKADTRIPDTTFDKTMTLDLKDGQSIVLTYLGSNNGRGSITEMFPAQKTLFVVDWIVLGRLPYQKLQGYDLPGMIDSTRAVLTMDFDRFVGGHADMGSKADVERYLGYITALYEGTRDGILAGKSLAQIQKDLTLSDYSDLKMFAQWRKQNIEGAYNHMVDDDYYLMRPDVPKPAGYSAD